MSQTISHVCLYNYLRADCLETEYKTLPLPRLSSSQKLGDYELIHICIKNRFRASDHTDEF